MIILWTCNWLLGSKKWNSAALLLVVGKQYGAQSTPRHSRPQPLVSLCNLAHV